MELGKGFTLFFFFFNRAERIRVPEPWITPPDLQQKISLFAPKCLFLMESLKQFAGDVKQPARGECSGYLSPGRSLFQPESGIQTDDLLSSP